MSPGPQGFHTEKLEIESSVADIEEYPDNRLGNRSSSTARAPDDSVHDLDTDMISSVHVLVWEKKVHNALI